MMNSYSIAWYPSVKNFYKPTKLLEISKTGHDLKCQSFCRVIQRVTTFWAEKVLLYIVLNFHRSMFKVANILVQVSSDSKDKMASSMLKVAFLARLFCWTKLNSHLVHVYNGEIWTYYLSFCGPSIEQLASNSLSPIKVLQSLLFTKLPNIWKHF